MDEQKLLETAQAVLKQNDRGKWTVPSGNLYPHQWLWDSCFISIGLRNLDLDRAKIELLSLKRGQWRNGMLPAIIFSKTEQGKEIDSFTWRSSLSPFAPDGVDTTGITQPPMLAEAVVRIGQSLKSTERRSWYSQMYPTLLSFHEWLYRDRDPREEGLIVLIHPYESGLDDSPPWVSELHRQGLPLWVRFVNKLHINWLIHRVRTDTSHVPWDQRMPNDEAMAYWAALLKLRQHAYNSEAILSRPMFAVQDLAFNSILIRANTQLRLISKTIGTSLPRTLEANMDKTEKVLEELWDEASGQYYSRSFVSQKLIEEASISTLLPLYSGSISKERAKQLVLLLKNPKLYATDWPIPSAPLSSTHFAPFRYWQGPSWININWLIIDGLKRYGFDSEAEVLKKKTLELVEKSGIYEYFNPLTGEPAGTPNFSWTAALTVDLLKS